jgi:hypothetical protein
MFFINVAGKDVACSESAKKEIFNLPAYNLPYFEYSVGCKDRGLFFNGGWE